MNSKSISGSLALVLSLVAGSAFAGGPYGQVGHVGRLHQPDTVDVAKPTVTQKLANLNLRIGQRATWGRTRLQDAKPVVDGATGNTVVHTVDLQRGHAGSS